MNYSSIIKENKNRLKELFAPYDPITGVGSPIERFEFNIDKKVVWWLPMAMQGDDLISKVLTSKKTAKDFFNLDFKGFLEALLLERIKHDFEYWAVTTIKIPDKETGTEIAFRLNRPQKRILSRLEKMRVAGIPIRFIIHKARQMGISTVIQTYMNWLQLVHYVGWNSAIVADVEEQARTVRRFQTNNVLKYPLEKLTLANFEGSTKNKEIIERECVISIASMQKPHSLRSKDLKMAHLCISPDTPIIVKDGFIKKAKDIKIGDNVITHTGRKTKVKNITISKPDEFNGNGKAIIINTWLNKQNITVTPNHDIWTNKGWVNAKDLTKTHYVLMPKRNILDRSKLIKLGITIKRKQHGGTIGAGEGKTIPVNKEIGFFFGYYLAEGSINYNYGSGKKRRIPAQITLTRHDKEIEYADRAIRAILPYISSHTREKRKNTFTTQEHLYGVIIARFIENTLGVKEKKKIPDSFFYYGKNFLTGLIQGYLSGDGSKTMPKQDKYELSTMSITTVSQSLATQVRDIIASLQIGWGTIDFRGAGEYYGRNCKDTYILRYSGSAARELRNLIGLNVPDNGHKFSEKSSIKENFVWIKVKSISETTLKEVVDIEVGHSDHSFRTISFPVKNSEVGFWVATEGKKPIDLIRSIRGTIKSYPGTMIAMESTANGAGTFFHTEYLMAKNDDTAYEAFFAPWYEDERNIMKVPDYKEFIKTWNDYEQWLWGLGVTIEGIYWYRYTYVKEFNSDKWSMFTENPSNSEEGFQSTGVRYIPPQYIENIDDPYYITKPLWIGDLFPSENLLEKCLKDLDFQEYVGGKCSVWAKPDTKLKIKNRYLVIVDVGGKSPKADWSVIRVLDRYWMIDGGIPEFVFTWKGHLDPDLVAWKAIQIGLWYNKALVVIESNYFESRADEKSADHSITVINTVADNYENVYTRTHPEKIKEGAPSHYGFHMNKQTKPTAYSFLLAACRNTGFIERDKRAIDEYKTLEIDNRGRINAVDGCHDDIADSSAIGIYISADEMDPPRLIMPGKSKSKKIISEATF